MRSDTKTYYISCILFICLVVLLHIAEFNREVRVDRPARTVDPNVKVILSWNPFFGDPFYGFGRGERAFRQHGCEYANCRITDNKKELPQHSFDAVLFHGFEFYEIFYGKPRHRSAEQYYVFMSLESARRAAIPVRMRRFYNLTLTYRLDSDVPWPYFRVRDATGEIVAPAESVAWRDPTGSNVKISRNKSREIAWFVSNCDSTNGREQYAAELSKFVPVDVFGACGTLYCPLGEHERCLNMLKEEYYFYLAFENSHCEDYITEKVLTALKSDTVPIVYGNAELSRFLPPHSYIDANAFSPEDLAGLIKALIADRDRYEEYFWWKGVYSFEKSMPADDFPSGLHPLCSLCRILNERPESRERDSHEWWMGTKDHPMCVR